MGAKVRLSEGICVFLENFSIKAIDHCNIQIKFQYTPKHCVQDFENIDGILCQMPSKQSAMTSQSNILIID